jgi:hypothetical protein
MKLSILGKIASLTIICLLCVCCGNNYNTIEVQTLSSNNVRRVNDTVMEDSFHHLQFSRLSKPASFGMTADFKLPEEYQGHECYVVVSGRARSNYAQSDAFIVVVTHKDQEQISWMVMPVKYYITELNTWCPFRDSIRLPEKIDGKTYNLITIAAHLATSQKENFDLDTLRVSIKQKS